MRGDDLTARSRWWPGRCAKPASGARRYFASPRWGRGGVRRLRGRRDRHRSARRHHKVSANDLRAVVAEVEAAAGAPSRSTSTIDVSRSTMPCAVGDGFGRLDILCHLGGERSRTRSTDHGAHRQARGTTRWRDPTSAPSQPRGGRADDHARRPAGPSSIWVRCACAGRRAAGVLALKAGAEAFTRCWPENRPAPIRVNMVHPLGVEPATASRTGLARAAEKAAAGRAVDADMFPRSLPVGDETRPVVPSVLGCRVLTSGQAISVAGGARPGPSGPGRAGS